MRLTAKRNEVDRKSNYITDINNVYVDELDNGYKFATGKAIEKLGRYEDIEKMCEKICKQPIYKKCLDVIYCQVYIGLDITYNFLTNCIEVSDSICRRDALSVYEYGVEWAFSKEELE